MKVCRKLRVKRRGRRTSVSESHYSAGLTSDAQCLSCLGTFSPYRVGSADSTTPCSTRGTSRALARVYNRFLNYIYTLPRVVWLIKNEVVDTQYRQRPVLYCILSLLAFERFIIVLSLWQLSEELRLPTSQSLSFRCFSLSTRSLFRFVRIQCLNSCLLYTSRCV